MVFTANRDITKGEECVIAYFDLAVIDILDERQGLVESQFRFHCTCERCLEEECDRNMAEIESMPFCHI